jgi:DnaK suppressor protein
MNDDEKNKLRDLIENEIQALKNSINLLSDTVKPVAPDNAIGRLTRMEAISSKGVSEASLRSARTRLSKLEQALQNIDQPEFGTCVSCGETIPFKRMLVMPETRMCVKCIDGKG